MTIQHPIEDEVMQLARRVEKARGRLAYQFDPALTEALSEDELLAERELAERIRGQDRGQRWKQVQAAAAAADRARQTTEEIEKADIRDLLVARKAIAAQRRESSPHAKLASLYRHRAWSLRALAGVVGAGMLWSAVNVQQNIAPGGPTDPLFWFSYLIEAMISVCLIIIMIGTNKVAEWGVVDNRKQVVAAEIALLSLTVGLNTYPYVRAQEWFEIAVHAVAPVMIGVALLIHDAASARYGFAIAKATDQVRELPDPAELIRRSLPTIASYRLNAQTDSVPSGLALTAPEPEDIADEPAEPDELDAAEVELADDEAVPSAGKNGAASRFDKLSAAPLAPALLENGHTPSHAGYETAENGHAPRAVEPRPSAPEADPEPTVKTKRPAPATNGKAAPTAVEPEQRAVPKPAEVVSNKPAVSNKTAETVRTSDATADVRPAVVEPSPAPKPAPEPAPARQPAAAEARTASARNTAPRNPAAQSQGARSTQNTSTTAGSGAGKPAPAPAVTATTRSATPKINTSTAKISSSSTAAKKRVAAPPDPDATDVEIGRAPGIYDTGQFRISEILEQELAEMQAERRRARTSRPR